VFLQERFVLSSIVSDDGAAAAVPEMVARLRDVMSGYSRPWSLCGGWAVDAWLGRVTREHGDVDVSVFGADCDEVQRHFSGWQLVAHGPGVDNNAALWDGRPLGTPSHLHGRPPELITGPPAESGIMQPVEGWWLDVQIDERAGPEWVLHASPRVALAMSEAVRESVWGVPTASPEVVLFFKSRDLRRRDRADFAELVPLLSRGRRAWLREAIAAVGHPWMRELEE
jgi:hypothetical protein